jgi:hypothetical protein
MITKEEAKQQMARFEVLRGFPSMAASQKDMLAAIMTATSATIAAMAIGKLLDGLSESDRCPLAATIRGAIYDAQSANTEKRVRCKICGGIGQIVRFLDVEFVDGTYTPKRCIRKLDHLSDLQRLEYAQTLPKNRSVLSAAQNCSCRASVS